MGTNVSEGYTACIFRVGVSEVGKVVDYMWVDVEEGETWVMVDRGVYLEAGIWKRAGIGPVKTALSQDRIKEA